MNEGAYPSKLPAIAVHLLNGDVIPALEAHGAKIEVVLSDLRRGDPRGLRAVRGALLPDRSSGNGERGDRRLEGQGGQQSGSERHCSE